MKILYIHGLGACFDIESPKCKALSTIGEVVGITIDYTLPYITIDSMLQYIIYHENVDMIVGCSLGGYWTAEMGTRFRLPHVMLNPSTVPGETLLAYADQIYTPYVGKPGLFKREEIEQYKAMPVGENGFTIVAKDDDIIPFEKTLGHLNSLSTVKIVPTGGHRLNNLAEFIEEIAAFYEKYQTII